MTSVSVSQSHRKAQPVGSPLYNALITTFATSSKPGESFRFKTSLAKGRKEETANVHESLTSKPSSSRIIPNGNRQF
jgi:hypothetical protein